MKSKRKQTKHTHTHINKNTINKKPTITRITKVQQQPTKQQCDNKKTTKTKRNNTTNYLKKAHKKYKRNEQITNTNT